MSKKRVELTAHIARARSGAFFKQNPFYFISLLIKPSFLALNGGNAASVFMRTLFESTLRL